MNPTPPDWRLADFDFTLPEGCIAAHPAAAREDARLLHVNGCALGDFSVRNMPELLHTDDLLVLNDTKVVPARLFGQRDAVKIEVLLNKPEADAPSVWSALARPGKRLKAGQMISFAPNFEAEVIEKREDGEILIRFNVEPDGLFALLKSYGQVPLPPYIKRPQGPLPEDAARYQTVYAAREGAVAAPTAGLHFTPELLAQLKARGIEPVFVTLHVGAGTFLPVKTDRVTDHKMHAEWGEITPETANRINAAKKEGRRIVAVGTTALRLLESAAGEDGRVRAFSDETNIFIVPGYRFKAVDALMTNFHLPKSTLFMLVCAFAGMDAMKAAYTHAIAHTYRFYSYGDATLLERKD